MSDIKIDKAFLQGLKKAYDKAVKDEEVAFKFQGHEFVTSYAKYFIEFYGAKFNIKP